MKPLLGTIVAAALGLLCAAGCGSKLAEELEGYAEKACACADAACAQKVQTEFEAWAERNKMARGSADERKRAEKAMRRFSECMNRHTGAPEVPSSAPSAP